QRRRAAVAHEVSRLTAAVVPPGDVDAGLLAKLGSPLLREAHALDLLRRPELAYDDLQHVAPWTPATASSADAAAVDQPLGMVAAEAGASPTSLFPPSLDWRGDERLAAQVKLQ